MIKKLMVIMFLIAQGTGQSAAYVLCEGNFMTGNSTLWQITDGNEITGIENNPLGDTGQSMTIYENKLFAIINGTGTIEVFDIQPSGNLTFLQSVNLNFSGPREMVVLDEKGYITEWYTTDIAILDISSLTVIGNIPVPGLPEDIVTDGEFIYASITMNPDWTSANQIVVIDPETESIITGYQVAEGPGAILLINNELIVSSTYYDDNWNAFAATSKVNLATGEVLINDYGQTDLFGTDIIYHQGNIYRIYNDGIIQLDNSLSPLPGSYFGNFPGLYSMKNHQNHIYLGLSNFTAPDEVRIVNFSGEEINSFSVGAIPGSFAFFNPSSSCEVTGDVNHDSSLDILDLIQMISYILGIDTLTDDGLCISDSNYDSVIDVTDIVFWVDQILSNR